jgi:hypothetical protein
MGYSVFIGRCFKAMEINKIPEAGQARKSSQSRPPKTAAADRTAGAQAQDRVELVSAHDRDVVLNSIRAKIRQGFYRSEEVTDDITEKLAHLFERS